MRSSKTAAALQAGIAAALLALLTAPAGWGQYGAIRTRRGGAPKTTGIPADTPALAGTFHGILKQLSNKEIVLQNTDDQTVVIRRSKKTKFLMDGKEVKASAIHINELVSVDATADVDLKPTALTLTVDAAPRKN